MTQKLSPTELLKQQMKEKEMRGVRTGGRRRLASTVFEPEVTKLVKEMKAYEEVEDAEEGSDLLEWWKTTKPSFLYFPTWPGWFLQFQLPVLSRKDCSALQDL